MMVTVVQNGPDIPLSETCIAIIKWTEANHYKINGPSGEIYLRPAANASQTDPDSVTEIQFLVGMIGS